MKKAFILLLAIASCISMSAQTKTVISGDYDGDGQITVGDLEYMAGIVLGNNQAMELEVVDKPSEDEDDNESNPDFKPASHEYVDLGVVVDGKPVYWATTNIGAELPADTGLYFAWGETVGYGTTPRGEMDKFGIIQIYDGRKFDWESYSSDLCGGVWNKMKKYCISSNQGIVDNKTVLDPEDDAAHVNWQGEWRMPTNEELRCLIEQCTWTCTKMTNSDGEEINGYKVSNKNNSNNFIFLPATGGRNDVVLDGFGRGGNYWSATLATWDSSYAGVLWFGSDNVDLGDGNRCGGFPIRPVCQ